MLNVFQNAMAIVSGYNGSGLYLMVYLLALVFLFATEKDKGRRIIFCYLGAVVFGLIYFPLTAYMVMYKVMDEEIFYRQIWLIPCGASVCYALVRLIMRVGEKAGKKAKVIIKSVTAVMAAALIVLTGNYVFRSDNYVQAENIYHLPQYVVDVCDTIELVGTDYNYSVAFPASIVQFNRQYTAGTHSPYGRDAIVEKYKEAFNTGNHLLDLIEAPSYNAKELFTEASDQMVEVLVLYGFKEMEGNPEDYGFSFYKEVDGYAIYSVFWIQEYFAG